MWKILLKIGKGLLPIIPDISERLLEKVGGKKTIWGGAITTAAGIGLFFVPGAQGYAISTTAGGVATLSLAVLKKQLLKPKKGCLTVNNNINDTQEVLAAVVPLANYINKKIRGEKFSVGDLDDIVGTVMKLPAAIENIKDVPVELRDVNAEEAAILDEEILKLDVAGDKNRVAQAWLKAGVEIGKAVAITMEEDSGPDEPADVPA